MTFLSCSWSFDGTALTFTSSPFSCSFDSLYLSTFECAKKIFLGPILWKSPRFHIFYSNKRAWASGSAETQTEIIAQISVWLPEAYNRIIDSYSIVGLPLHRCTSTKCVCFLLSNHPASIAPFTLSFQSMLILLFGLSLACPWLNCQRCGTILSVSHGITYSSVSATPSLSIFSHRWPSWSIFALPFFQHKRYC